MLRTLRRHKDLLYMLSRRDITVKYKQSVMGLLWAVLMPLLITCAGVMVKLALASVSGRPARIEDALPVAVKSIPWAFFVASLRFSTQSLSGNQNLVTKIAFPRAVFPLSAVASQLFDFCVASVVLVIAFAFAPVHLTVEIAWVPVLLGLLLAQVIGLALLLSAANLFFRDVKYLVEVFLTFAIFFTPVFYEVRTFGARAQLLLLNPIAPLLEGLGDAVVGGRAPSLGWTLYSAAWAALLLLVAPVMFQRLEPKFAESA